MVVVGGGERGAPVVYDKSPLCPDEPPPKKKQRKKKEKKRKGKQKKERERGKIKNKK